MQMRIAALVILLGASTSGANESPPCADRCAELEESGQLRPGMSKGRCEVQVCQEAAQQLYRDADYIKAWNAVEFLKTRLNQNSDYQVQRGMVLYALGKFNQALVSFDIAGSLRTKSVRIGAQRAHTLLRMGKLDEAKSQFEILLGYPAAESEYKNLRTKSYVHGNIGVIQLLKAQLDDAEQSFTTALEIDGRNALARAYRDKILAAIHEGRLDNKAAGELMVYFEELGLKRYRQAGGQLERVLHRWPKFDVAYIQLAEIHRGFREYHKCAVVLGEGEKQLPDHVEIHAERIRCSLLEHGVDSAAGQKELVALKKLAKAHPENALLKKILKALQL